MWRISSGFTFSSLQTAEKKRLSGPPFQAFNSSDKKTFSKVVPINPTSSSRIKIMRPSDINDSTNVANEIKEGRLVIFDVGQIDNEEARRIVDFMSGAAYGVNGKVRRVSEGIFVAAPKNIDITGDTMKEHVKNGMDWNFM